MGRNWTGDYWLALSGLSEDNNPIISRGRQRVNPDVIVQVAVTASDASCAALHRSLLGHDIARPAVDEPAAP